MRAYAFAGLILLVLATAPKPARAGDFEDAVLAEINQARAHPQAYARELRRQQVRQASYANDGYAAASEDPDAVEEAIQFLMRQSPLPPLSLEPRLATAAGSFAAQQGPTGAFGHGPHGGFGRRIQAAGVSAGVAAEGISYGQRTPQDVVRQLVVDSGVPDRGHRRDLFSGAYQASGVGCGGHARWGAMCVIDYAGAMAPR